MSRIYFPVWKQTLPAWISFSIFLIGALAYAGPTGGIVSVGSGTIDQAGNITTVIQNDQNLVINWQSFSIGADESVNFVQPNASAIVLNRVLGQDPSQIFGPMNANGQVFIVNPNGVLFSAGSQVSVGGLVASTLNISDADLMAGQYTFSRNGATGSVVNQGALTASRGGYISLFGPEVRNEGLISATLGTALLAAGDKISLTLNNGSLLSYNIDQGALQALAENKQLIQTDGGQVFLSARAANEFSTAAVNNTGIIKAHSLENRDGVIMLIGDMQAGVVNVGGTLDASAPNGGNGGFIETSAAHVNIRNDLQVTTAAVNGRYGTWLIDPQDYNVAESGGNISGTALSAALATTNVTLLSSSGGVAGSGNVNVNDAVSWSANTILTLTASNSVNINADITATGNTAGLVINPHTANGGENPSMTGAFTLGKGAIVTLSGLNPSLSIEGFSYTVINSLGVAGSTTATDLQGINGGLAGRYALGSNIDASATAAWNAGAGFAPIGVFNGTFDGLGHTISNLTVTRGLFSTTSGAAIIRNVGLLAANVNGTVDTGALVGINSGLISNTYSTGSVNGSGAHFVGGLVGWNQSGTISNSYSTVSVNGSSAGGLIGNNSGTVSDSYATGSVTGSTLAGGLVGYNSGSISNTYATGLVSGAGAKGGLVQNNAGTVLTSYWDTQTTGQATGIGAGTNSGAFGLTTTQSMLMTSYTGFNIANTGDSGAVWRIYEGNTTPWLVSFLRPIRVIANDDSRTFSGVPYSGGNGVLYSVPIPNPALSGVLGAYGGTSQGAVSPGTYTLVATGLFSVQQGYDISYVSGTLTITPLVTDVIPEVPLLPDPPSIIETPWDTPTDGPPLTLTNDGMDSPPNLNPPVVPPPVTAKPEPPVAAPIMPPPTEADRLALSKKKQLKEGANILFDFDKSEPKNIPFLNEMADIAINGKMKITIFAHTDIVGSTEYNRKLSMRRAIRVKELLMERGVAANRIQIIGEGRGSPAADNRTIEGRALNRRAVIKGIENENKDEN